MGPDGGRLPRLRDRRHRLYHPYAYLSKRNQFIASANLGVAFQLVVAFIVVGIFFMSPWLSDAAFWIPGRFRSQHFDGPDDRGTTLPSRQRR